MSIEGLFLERMSAAFSVLGLGLLMYGLYLVFSPFIPAISWAAVLVLTTWPIYRRLTILWPQSPSKSAGVMTAALALIFFAAVGPLLLTLSFEVERASVVAGEFISSEQLQLPAQLQELPLVGPLLTDQMHLLRLNRHEFAASIAEYKKPIMALATAAAKGIFATGATFFLCLFVSFFFFRDGDELARQANTAATKLGGERFVKLLESTKMTIKGAVYGVLLTSLAQGILAGVGYLVAGAPVPILLSAVTMLASLIPFGTPLVYLPVSILIVVNGAPTIYGVLLAVYCLVVVSSADNVLRPFFISQATSMPVLLSFFGVLGGLVTFGLIGIIIGPSIVAVGHALWNDWIDKRV